MNHKRVLSIRPGQLRIAIFEPFGNLWGSERSLLDFLEAVPADDYKVFVYCPKDAKWLPRLDGLGITYEASFELDLHRKSRARRMLAFAKFCGFVIRSKVNLIHVNQSGAGPYALLAGRLLRKPVIIHSRWHEDAQTIISWRPNPNILRKIVCISEHQKRFFPPGDILDLQRLIVIRNPYKTQTEWNSEILLPDTNGPARFVCPARLHPHKGQDLLLRATSLRSKYEREFTVELVGSSEGCEAYADGLHALSRSLGIERVIIFAGTSQDVVATLRGATAMVLPSHTEALGRVVFEAWDAGVVPIAWEGSGGPAELLQLSRGGILYKHQTPESLAEAMLAAAKLSGEARLAIVHAGRTWLKENCSPAVYASRLCRVWREAANHV